MQAFQVLQGLLSISVAMIIIPFANALQCEECADIRNAQILKNTVPDFNLDIGSLKFQSHQQCRSALGVPTVECPRSSSNSTHDYRCVHYSGALDLTIGVGTSGEAKVRYEGTYRDCLLESIFASGSCTDQIAILPYGSKLRAAALSTSPYNLTSYSVTVEFNGRKCVSDKNGIFLNKPTSSAAMTGFNFFGVISSYIIIQVSS